jgi:RNA polymerase sigma factor (sigma-70 family)
MNKTEERELLLRYRPRLRRMAASMTLQFPDRADDLAQEAWIALWLATRTYDGRDGVTLDYWLIRNAHDRMRVMIRHWTAQCRDARRTELAGDPREKIEAYSDDHTSEFTGTASDTVWVELTTDLVGIENAYHYGEIAQAMAELTPRQREYIYLRYCRGFNTAELTSHFGYPPKTVGQQARKNLAKSLAQLELSNA